MKYIKIWCEYDFGGSFGGDNNEDVFIINDEFCDIDEIVLAKLSERTNLLPEQLEDLYGWEYITPDYL